MFTELVELGRRETKLHPALAPCQCDYDIVIDNDGRFLKLIKMQQAIDYRIHSKHGQKR